VTDLPKLYPGHRYQWTDQYLVGSMAFCTICGDTMPRSLHPPIYDISPGAFMTVEENRPNPEQDSA
jgi:hypothetical protein